MPITELTDKEIAKYCRDLGWTKRMLPYGFPTAQELDELIQENSPSILEEAVSYAPFLNIYEYLAGRTCLDDWNNEGLWQDAGKKRP